MLNPTQLLSVFLLASSLVAAGDICAYTSRNCIGTYGCCANIPEGVCCTYPANYGWSTKWQGMPLTAYWLGRTFGDTCTTTTGGGGSTGGQTCYSVWDAPNYLNARSANWDADTRTKRSFDKRDAAAPCMEVNVIGFTTKDGEEHRFEIPEGKKFEDVEKLVKEGSFEEVFKLKRVA